MISPVRRKEVRPAGRALTRLGENKMKLKKKSVALLLAGALLVGGLSACSTGGGQPTPTPQSQEDLILKLMGYPRDTVLFTVDGEDVIAEDYLYWLGYVADYMSSYYQYLGAGEMDWTEEQDGKNLGQHLMEEAMATAKMYRIVTTKAAEMGVGITKEDEEKYATELASIIVQMGGQEGLEEYLRHSLRTQEGFDSMNKASYLYLHLRDKLFGAEGEQAPTDEDIDAYIEENQILSAKHILISTVDMAGERDPETGAYPELDEALKAEKTALAQDLLGRLRASEDPVALFEELMQEYSEDDGLATNPDGYVFTPESNFVPEFIEGTQALEYGEISDLVESGYGYHILLRQDPDNETLREEWSDGQMSALVDQWIQDAVVKTTEEYDSLDPEKFYQDLQALRAEMEAEAEPTPDVEATPSADPAATPGA